MIHKPVLLKEVLQYFDPKPNENFIDCTVGEAGHTFLLLEKNKPQGRVLGLDLDAGQIQNACRETEKFGSRAVLVNDSYVHLKEIVERTNFNPVHGILLDLGYSSWHIEQSGKGFSFMKDEVLDMRYDAQNVITARKIVNEYPENQIQKILQEYGQERFAKKIAKMIFEERKLRNVESTFQLKRIIEKAIPVKYQRGRIHCATRSFQALRIEVNDELQNLKKILPDAVSVLVSGGRLVVISFHSLEDRIIKNFFKFASGEVMVKILTPKPIIASKREVEENSRARSAKLRAIIKI